MSAPSSYLIDTNILLRLARKIDPQYPLIVSALNELDVRDAELYFSLQNVVELWNVCTRPASQNGFGLTVEEAIAQVEAIELNMTLLPDKFQVYEAWKKLVSTHRVSGVQVHDARLAAIMEVYGIQNLLTLNGADFKRFAQVVAVHPAEII